MNYHLWTHAGELPPTKTYPKPGQRLYYLQAPGVSAADAHGEPTEFCLFDVQILQSKGSKDDAEAYHVWQLVGDDVRNLPRDQYGRAAESGYLFVCFSREPTQDRPGVYKVACDRSGAAYWCGCLGSVGHKQQSDCKHRDCVSDIAQLPARTDRPSYRQLTQESSSERAIG